MTCEKCDKIVHLKCASNATMEDYEFINSHELVIYMCEECLNEINIAKTIDDLLNELKHSSEIAKEFWQENQKQSDYTDKIQKSMQKFDSSHLEIINHFKVRKNIPEIQLATCLSNDGILSNEIATRITFDNTIDEVPDTYMDHHPFKLTTSYPIINKTEILPEQYTQHILDEFIITDVTIEYLLDSVQWTHGLIITSILNIHNCTI